MKAEGATMSWISLPRIRGRNRVAKRAPESLVVLLHDSGCSAALIASIAGRWSVTVPSTTFIALDGHSLVREQLRDRSGNLADTASESNDEAASLNITAQNLEALLDHQLRSHRLDRA